MTTPTADFATSPFQVAYSRADAEYVVIEAATSAILSYHGNGATGHQRAYEAAAGLNYEAARNAEIAQADEEEERGAWEIGACEICGAPLRADDGFECDGLIVCLPCAGFMPEVAA